MTMFNSINLIVLSQIDEGLAKEQADKLHDGAMLEADYCLNSSYSIDFLDLCPEAEQ